MSIPYGPILVVEDVLHILHLLEVTLRFKGYPVITAINGEDALERIEQEHPAMIITDILMPKMDGFALASALQKEAPHLNVVLMTGYARDTEVQAGTIQNIVNRLQKPLNLHQLADAMQQALA